MDVPAIIRSSPPGSVFRFAAGVYRVGEIRPGDRQVLIGERGAILNGSVLLEDWRRDGALWRARLPAPPLPRSGPMNPGATAGSFREDLFIDDVRQRRVSLLRRLRAGTWFRDSRGEAVIGTDPAGRRVEIGSRELAIGGDAENVTLRSLTVEKYATAAQMGAIHGHEARGWRLSGLVVRWNHGTGINIGPGFVVEGGRVYENGQLGIGGGGAHGAVIAGVEIARNNYAGYDVYWEAGGVKIAVTRGITMSGNYVHRNNGVGLWGDIDVVDARYVGNLVVENAQSGIMHEISYAALIEGNMLLRNGQAERQRLAPSQVLIQNSQQTLVRCNYIEIGPRVGNGITMVYADRGSGRYGPWDTRDNVIEENTIVHLDSGGNNGFATNFRSATAMAWRNTWRNNTYVVPRSSGAHWDRGDAPRQWPEVERRWESGSSMLVEHRPATPDPGSLRDLPLRCGGQGRLLR